MNDRIIKDAQWHEQRKNGIGGSEAAAVLGISPWKTSLRLWKEKRGEIEAEEVDEKEAVYWGNILEGIIAEEYARRTGYELWQKTNGVSVHPAHEWMICNVDRHVRGVSGLIVEIKTVGAFRFDPSVWGMDGSDMIPSYYYAQVQHNIAVTNAVQCDMPVLIGGQQFRLYRIPRNEEFIARLIDAERSFVHSLRNAVAPPAVNLSDLQLLFPTADLGRHVEANEETAQAWAQLCDLKRRISNGKKWAEQYEFKIKQAMGDAAQISFNGVTLATWKGAKRRTFRIKMPAMEGEGAEFEAE